MAGKVHGHHYTLEDRIDTLRITMPAPTTGFFVLVILIEAGLSYPCLLFALTDRLVYGAAIGVLALLFLFVAFTRNSLVVEITSQSIAIWDDFVGIRLLPNRYLARHISRLRVSDAAEAGKAAFDYGAATVTFGRGLKADGVAEIVAAIDDRFPQYQREPGEARAQLARPFDAPPSADRELAGAVEAPLPRYTSEVLGNTLRITIPSSGKWFTHILAVLGWSLIAAPALPSLVHAAVWIQIGCGLWWLLGLIFITYNLLKELLGKEEIEVTPDSLAIRETVFGKGRPRVYDCREISRLRVDPAGRVGPYAPNDEGNMSLRQATGMIAFDYRDKYGDRMGIHLTEAEAKALLGEIQRQYPQYKK